MSRDDARSPRRRLAPLAPGIATLPAPAPKPKPPRPPRWRSAKARVQHHETYRNAAENPEHYAVLETGTRAPTQVYDSDGDAGSSRGAAPPAPAGWHYVRSRVEAVAPSPEDVLIQREDRPEAPPGLRAPTPPDLGTPMRAFDLRCEARAWAHGYLIDRGWSADDIVSLCAQFRVRVLRAMGVRPRERRRHLVEVLRAAAPSTRVLVAASVLVGVAFDRPVTGPLSVRDLIGLEEDAIAYLLATPRTRAG